MAARLVDAGVDTERVYGLVFEAMPLRKLRLQITVATVEYQAQMRELQEERRRAS